MDSDRVSCAACHLIVFALWPSCSKLIIRQMNNPSISVISSSKNVCVFMQESRTVTFDFVKAGQHLGALGCLINDLGKEDWPEFCCRYLNFVEKWNFITIKFLAFVNCDNISLSIASQCITTHDKQHVILLEETRPVGYISKWDLMYRFFEWNIGNCNADFYVRHTFVKHFRRAEFKTVDCVISLSSDRITAFRCVVKIAVPSHRLWSLFSKLSALKG